MAEPEQWTAGRMLESARLSAGLSIRAAARYAGISDGRWRQIENGVQNVGGGMHVPARPRPDTLARMAKVVGIDPRILLEAAGMSRHIAERVAGDSEAPESEDSIEAWIGRMRRSKAFTPEQREMLIAQMEVALARQRSG